MVFVVWLRKGFVRTHSVAATGLDATGRVFTLFRRSSSVGLRSKDAGLVRRRRQVLRENDETSKLKLLSHRCYRQIHNARVFNIDQAIFELVN